MNDMLLKSEASAVLRALQSDYCPLLLRDARETQTRILLEKFKQAKYRIADIGCGQGIHGNLYAPFSELYHGFEISKEIAAIAKEQWHSRGLDNAEVIEADVAEAVLQKDFYHWAICLYFTAGNFRDITQDLSFYTDAYLDRNPVFMRIISNFYRALKPGGSIFLTVYRDVPEAEVVQYDYYLNTGQTIVTKKGSRFVATTENFWSVRWTKQSMLSNLELLPLAEEQVIFHELNSIAWLVEIKKAEMPE